MDNETKLALIDVIVADALECKVCDQGIILAIGAVINFQGECGFEK